LEGEIRGAPMPTVPGAADPRADRRRPTNPIAIPGEADRDIQETHKFFKRRGPRRKREHHFPQK